MLEFPTMNHEKAAIQFKNEFFEHGERVINGSALLDQMEYSEWLKNVQNNANPETVRGDWVQATTFFAVRSFDKKIIGMVDIRHNLNNDFLMNYGGHIGYAVRPSERRKGYGTQILAMAIDYAREIGLKRVMLGCHSDNIASLCTIEKCGGICTENKIAFDQKPMKVYWFDLL